MASGEGLGLFFNLNQIPCGPPAAPPPVVNPITAPTVILGVTTGGSGDSITGGMPSGVPIGSLMLACIALSRVFQDTADIQDPSGPAGWTQIATHFATGGPHGDMKFSLWAHVATGFEPPTYTWSWSGTGRIITMSSIAFSGSGGVDVVGVPGDSPGPNVTVPGVTPLVNNDILCILVADASGSGSTWLVPAGWTQGIAVPGQSNGVFTQIAPSAGTPAASQIVACAQTDTSIGYMLAIKGN